MTSLEKFEYWAALSDYDIKTSKALMDAKRWTYVAALCQQSVERYIKGMYVYYEDKEAPKSHNIPFIMNKLSQNMKFASNELGKRFNIEKVKYESFIIDLMFYYMSDYPISYKKIMERYISEKTATDLYNNTIELLDWLKAFYPQNALSGAAIS